MSVNKERYVGDGILIPFVSKKGEDSVSSLFLRGSEPDRGVINDCDFNGQFLRFLLQVATDCPGLRFAVKPVFYRQYIIRRGLNVHMQDTFFA